MQIAEWTEDEGWSVISAPRIDLTKDQYDIGRRNTRALLSWAALTRSFALARKGTWQLGQKLLRKAHDLAPADPQWTIYLHHFELAKQEMAQGEQPPPDLGSAPPGTLVRRIKAEYPEPAKIPGGGYRNRWLENPRGHERQSNCRPARRGARGIAGCRCRSCEAMNIQAFRVGESPVEAWKEVAVHFP